MALVLGSPALSMGSSNDADHGGAVVGGMDGCAVANCYRQMDYGWVSVAAAVVAVVGVVLSVVVVVAVVVEAFLVVVSLVVVGVSLAVVVFLVVVVAVSLVVVGVFLAVVLVVVAEAVVCTVCSFEPVGFSHSAGSCSAAGSVGCSWWENYLKLRPRRHHR